MGVEAGGSNTSLARASILAGETVAVMGQGSAGLFWTYLLKQAGAAQIIVSDLSDTRLAVASSYGADVCVNAGNNDLSSAVGDLTMGKGVDYLVEAVGRPETFRESVDHVRMDGEIMWFGLPSVDSDIEMRFHKFFRKRLSAASTYGAQDETDSASFREALDLIANGAIDVAPLLSHIFPVEKIDEAMHLAHEPHEDQALKVSIEFS